GIGGVPTRYCLQTVLPSGVNLIESAMIVRGTGGQLSAAGPSLAATDFSVAPNVRRQSIAVEAVQVVSARRFAPGTPLELVTNAYTNVPALPLKQGSLYYVLAMKQVDGRLPQPFWVDGCHKPESMTAIGAAAADEVSLLAAFPTDQVRLSQNPSADGAFVEDMVRAYCAETAQERGKLLAMLEWFGQKPYHDVSGNRWTVSSERQADTAYAQLVRALMTQESSPSK